MPTRLACSAAFLLASVFALFLLPLSARADAVVTFGNGFQVPARG